MHSSYIIILGFRVRPFIAWRQHDHRWKWAFFSDAFFRFENRLWERHGAPRPKRSALDAYQLINQVGLRVILIEAADGKFYGTLDGKVVKSDEKFVLYLKSISDGSIHRFAPPSSFEWYQERFFIKSTIWRRYRYVTPAALELRRQTSELYEAARAKGVFRPGQEEYWRESCSAYLRWHLSARLGIPLDSNQTTLMEHIQEI